MSSYTQILILYESGFPYIAPASCTSHSFHSYHYEVQ